MTSWNPSVSRNRRALPIKRGYSNEQLLLLENDSFDIIYIDGNHEPEYVMEDVVLSFRKLKQN
jgi:hypothetical protein|uniref:Methyltransferase n=1 Tax=viral metagenome TaxID=1070528 RepID=A0A6C0BGS8_9ZZZZ